MNPSLDPSIDDDTRSLARKLWDYHRLSRATNSTADFVLALGSHDERVAQHAAKLVKDGVAPLLVTSGGLGKVTAEIWQISEGQRFRPLRRQGRPKWLGP